MLISFIFASIQTGIAFFPWFWLPIITNADVYLSTVVGDKQDQGSVNYNSLSNYLAHFPENHNEADLKSTSLNKEAYFYLGAINRAQQAHFFENRKFGNTNKELGLESVSVEENFELTISNQGNSAFAYAIPKTDNGTYKDWSGAFWLDETEPLYSYVSGVAFMENDYSFQAILCVSRTVGQQPLQEPQIINGKFAFYPGTEEIP